MSEEPLFDVVAVNLKTGAERFLDQRKTERNAEAIVDMAVIRRGVDVEFYTTKPHPHTLRAHFPATEIIDEVKP